MITIFFTFWQNFFVGLLSILFAFYNRRMALILPNIRFLIINCYCSQFFQLMYNLKVYEDASLILILHCVRDQHILVFGTCCFKKKISTLRCCHDFWFYLLCSNELLKKSCKCSCEFAGITLKFLFVFMMSIYPCFFCEISRPGFGNERFSTIDF